MRSLWYLFVVAALTLCMFSSRAFAQDLARQPTAFTAYVDFHAKTRDLPIWIERIEKHSTQPSDDLPDGKTTYRIRFRHFNGLVDEVLLRVYFQDAPDARPVLSGWSEIGARTLDPITLGQGLGLPTSQSVTLQVGGIDYVDIDVPGDGYTVRGALALAVRKAETRTAMDFGAAPAATDPFGSQPPALTGSDDTLLFGRVKATLEPGTISLGTGDSPSRSAGFEFQLANAPQIALLTFEVLNPDIANPPHLSVNGQDVGDVNVVMTDLADPALTGAVEAARRDPVYHYGGWLKAQKVIPGSLLLAGTNDLLISTPGSSTTPIAIRAVEMQFKYTTDAATP